MSEEARQLYYLKREKALQAYNKKIEGPLIKLGYKIKRANLAFMKETKEDKEELDQKLAEALDEYTKGFDER